MFKRVLALMAVAWAAQASAAHAAPVLWGVNGHAYDVIAAEGITWTEARSAAQALGAGWDLASIGDAAEDQFVQSLLPLAVAERSHYWIGGTDVAIEGSFAWVDGTPWTYQNFWGGEPNNAFDDEHYLAYDLRGSTYAWNDAPNSLAQFGFARGYVAERGVQTVPEPATALLALGGLAAVWMRRRDIR